MSERLDLAEAVLQGALGRRLDGLTPMVVREVARHILEAADAFVDPMGPRFYANHEADLLCCVPLTLAEALTAVKGTLIPGMPVAFERARQSLIAKADAHRHRDPELRPAPSGRVTREMVLGDHPPRIPESAWACRLCGALLAASDASADRHAAWHDRLGSLLVAEG